MPIEILASLCLQAQNSTALAITKEENKEKVEQLEKTIQDKTEEVRGIPCRFSLLFGGWSILGATLYHGD